MKSKETKKIEKKDAKGKREHGFITKPTVTKDQNSTKFQNLEQQHH
jgi:hypothetical protein